MKSFQLFRKALPSFQRGFTTTKSNRTARPSPFFSKITNTARRRPFSTPLRHRRPYSTDPKKPAYNPTPNLNSPTPSLSLSQRLRKLSREYGWSGFGVYLVLSALDFPFCFAAVRYLGTDRIGRYEHVVVEWIKSVIPESVAERWREARARIKSTAEDEQERGALDVGEATGEDTKVESYGVPVEGTVSVVAGYDHGVKEAEKMNNSENASKCSGDINSNPGGQRAHVDLREQVSGRN